MSGVVEAELGTRLHEHHDDARALGRAALAHGAELARDVGVRSVDADEEDRNGSAET